MRNDEGAAAVRLSNTFAADEGIACVQVEVSSAAVGDWRALDVAARQLPPPRHWSGWPQ